MSLQLQLPKDAPFTADVLAGIAAEATALGMNQEMGQKLADYRAANWPKAPDKYELKAPDGSGLQAADLEAISAEAKALGLSQKSAQQLVELRAKGAKAPDKYELKAPDGSALADADLALIADEAKALKLTPAAAQALVEKRAAVAAATSAQFLADLKSDPEIGGDKFDATLKLATKGRDLLFPPGAAETAVVLNLLNRTGLGNHKALVRAFARLGQMVAEDGAHGGGSGSGGGGGAKPIHDRMYPGMKKPA